MDAIVQNRAKVPQPPSHSPAVVANRSMERPPLFLGILPTDYQLITRTARRKSFSRGEMLHLRGDSIEQIVLVLAGWIKVTHLSKTGAEVILKLGVPGDVVGALGLWSGGKHDTTAQVFRSCQAYVWDARVFRGLTMHYPVLHQNMVRIVGEDLFELGERFREVATEKVSPRVARQLLRLQKKIGRSVGKEVEIGLSREELAQMTGTTLFTVSRLLSAWELSGIVKPSRESVTIRDIELLSAVAKEC